MGGKPPKKISPRMRRHTFFLQKETSKIDKATKQSESDRTTRQKEKRHEE